jgi:hypothetical protein
MRPLVLKNLTAQATPTLSRIRGNTPQGGISTFTKFINKKQEMNF